MNSFLTVSSLLATITVALAHPPSMGLIPISTIESIPNPNYAFDYAVNDPHTGDNKGQWEVRNGDVVKGAYHLVEPDGNIRVVEYHADSLHGFNAVVKKTGPSIHSMALPVHAPIAHLSPIEHLTPIEHGPIIGPIEHLAPMVPLEHEHIGHLEPTKIITPIIDAPILAPMPIPYLHHSGPLVHISGSTYGHHGHLKNAWSAGPISLDGQILTIRHKH